MIGNKIQPYKFTQKSFFDSHWSTMVVGYFCIKRIYLVVYPPEEAISIEGLRTHIRLIFMSAVSAAKQKIVRIGIIDDVDFYTGTFGPHGVDVLPTPGKYIDLNISADANRMIDFSINLSSLLTKANTGNSYIYIDFPSDIETDAFGYIGDVILWKADALFTTTGIR